MRNDNFAPQKRYSLTHTIIYMYLANLDLGPRPALLAPMEDVTDVPFRRLCKEYGATLMYTEFVAADAIVREIASSMRKLTISDQERPVGIQIYGRDVDSMVEAARIAEQARPDIIDLNFGCPVKKIASKGAGAGMLRDIPKMIEITREVVRAVRLPVTVKTRLGWDDEHRDIVTIAEQLQDVGIAALTIHGRTRAQMYTGEADWTLIGAVRNNPRMHIPIIGNGDITTAQRARECFDRYGVDAVMIGRAAIGRPWIFREVRELLDNDRTVEPPMVPEQVGILRRQVADTLRWIGDERRAVLHVRRHLAATFKGLPDFRDLKIRLLREPTIEGVNRCLDEIARRYPRHTAQPSFQ